ncbi:nitrate/sulfonate/bicarbonate ABC transporter ATP-binding protein [Anaerosporomusa subterranea]|uniref:Nitrate/sulfonate/bicarbonate ABC transporter ATP-binding protein n=1 Tax=Anaerosporomusa subterranea TaxID=1794912 RepID=A0A154BP70_ANASB|nr:ABC transporter ATP-binding protein [Anaerosporomusa subterranea]KYZ75650.1 nitrate/sulfonate/bicarbonate ABC transporter ATP-binding protein [Anaerosporomusa subterranea]
MITIKNLSVSYGLAPEQYEALRHISLELAGGETCAIVGPSGCGKSTLLRVLAGIITDFSGAVAINGQPITPHQQRIGFIPQNYGLLPWKNVAQNILLGVKIKSRQAADDTEALSVLLQQLGLKGLENRYPGELSGGQQQRVALARSFLLKPDLLLMDEPFSALDAITREEIQAVFLNAWRQRPVSTVLVTHHVEEAVYLGRKIVILTGRPGFLNTVIENPLFGVSDIRSSRDFFQLCLELRKKLKEEWTL